VYFDSNGSRVVLHVDPPCGPEIAQATRDGFGHARAKGLFPLADKLAPFL
jgi:hypothetical protein